jgi:hypothetical protein
MNRLSLYFASILVAAMAVAQQPAIENAKTEVRAFAGSLAAQLAQLGAGPFWAGYSEKSIPGRRGDWCCSNEGCPGYANGAPVRLEGQTALVVLVRMESGAADQLRIVSPDCKLDAGGLPFFWIDKVPADASIAWLKTQINGRHPDIAISAIAMHDGAAADQALNELTSPGEPERVREKAAFWIGTSRGAPGIATLKRMMANDPSDKVREQVVFALSQSKDPAGITTVIETARTDRSPRVRQRALFWLAQKAGNKQAVDVIGNAVVNDSDRAVRESAVFALKQLPGDQGIPLLIDLAKNNADPNVRKKAIFWLGQSRDPRALEFFEQVLKK